MGILKYYKDRINYKILPYDVYINKIPSKINLWHIALRCSRLYFEPTFIGEEGKAYFNMTVAFDTFEDISVDGYMFKDEFEWLCCELLKEDIQENNYREPGLGFKKVCRLKDHKEISSETLGISSICDLSYYPPDVTMPQPCIFISFVLPKKGG